MQNQNDIFLQQQIYATLFSVANKIQIVGDKLLAKLTSRQLMAMIAVAHLPEGNATLNNIARKLGTTKQSIKQVIEIIERKGYVATSPSELDKRAVNVQITENGKKVMIECGERGIKYFETMFREFTTEELNTFWVFLKKLYRFDGEEQDGFEEEAEIKT